MPETVAEMGRRLQPPVAFATESVAELCAWAKFKYPVKTGTRFVTRDRGSGPTTFIWSAPPPYGSQGRELAGGIELEAIRVITVVIPKGNRRWDSAKPGICIWVNLPHETVTTTTPILSPVTGERYTVEAGQTITRTHGWVSLCKGPTKFVHEVTPAARRPVAKAKARQERALGPPGASMTTEDVARAAKVSFRRQTMAHRFDMGGRVFTRTSELTEREEVRQANPRSAVCLEVPSVSQDGQVFKEARPEAGSALVVTVDAEEHHPEHSSYDEANWKVERACQAIQRRNEVVHSGDGALGRFWELGNVIRSGKTTFVKAVLDWQGGTENPLTRRLLKLYVGEARNRGHAYLKAVASGDAEETARLKKMLKLKVDEKGDPVCGYVGSAATRKPKPTVLEHLADDPVFQVVNEDGEVRSCPLLTKSGQESVFNTVLAALLGVGPQGYTGHEAGDRGERRKLTDGLPNG